MYAKITEFRKFRGILYSFVFNERVFPLFFCCEKSMFLTCCFTLYRDVLLQTLKPMQKLYIQNNVVFTPKTQKERVFTVFSEVAKNLNI